MGDTQPVYCRAYQRHDDSGPRALHADAPAGNGLSATLRNCPAKLSAAPDLRRPQQRKQPVRHARIAPRHAHHGDGTPSAAGTVTSERYAYDFVTGVEAEAPSWDLADTACQGSLNSFGCSIANSTSTSRPWARRPHCRPWAAAQTHLKVKVVGSPPTLAQRRFKRTSFGILRFYAEISQLR